MPLPQFAARRLCASTLLILLTLQAGACSRSERSEQAVQGDPVPSTPTPTPADTGAPDSIVVDSIPTVERQPLAYVRVRVNNPRQLRALIDSLGEAQWIQALKLNRVDLAHVREGDALVLPEAFRDSLDLSPFPPLLPSVQDTAKLVLVSLRLQAFAAYEHGRLVQWGPTSTGRRSKPTPVGRYHVNWKDRERISTVNEEWQLFWCVNIQNRQGVSLHQYELPGRPASHSCVRLLESDAMWVYAWTDQWKLSPEGKLAATGTPVVVFGAWAWGEPAPWKRLPEDPAAALLAPQEMDEALRILREGDRPHFEAKAETTLVTPS